jgi:flagella basal body P-ring formation protein FlgA
MMILRFCLFLFGLLVAYPAFADSTLRLVVPAHDIARGEVIADNDLLYQPVSADQMYPGAITDPTLLNGMEARRVLRAGEGLRQSDVRRPVIVAKGATVTMTFAAPGIELTTVGRAMSEGGLGESIMVQNPVSFRQINATVIGAGEVRAVAAIPPSRLAQ